ncbi:transglutaminase-like enzyme, predicted cysteine protease [Thioploca ingrica]|uniref:Transglutaminase-like enzyme, predicted cysteine protease n=1 Tax=Thioploca ingrica TaxID=40754 RepID=A0A090AJB7_9GAMM|nr:transglutaminase-like enzyme, predicted cysteine protease [Thioploca ingrica]
MKYRVTHQTIYHYNELASLCHNEAHLTPRDDTTQKCLSHHLRIEPLPAIQQNHQDFFGNWVTYFSIQIPHQVLTVTAASEVEIQHSGLIPFLTDSPAWEQVRDQLQSSLEPEVLAARELALDSPFITTNDLLHAYAVPSFTPQRPILDAAYHLMNRIYTEFTYDPNFTTIVTPLTEVLEHRRGVCQDFAHLMIGCLRSMGLAARYVSGYLETLPLPGQEKLQGSDASHAWLMVYVPNYGWVDFDPTNNQIPTCQHITMAWGRDYSDVTPLKGIIFGGGEHTLVVSVDVERLTSESAGLAMT